MKVAIAAVVCCAAHVAEAGHHCSEVSKVVGYQQCHRFGWWSHGASMWWELGAVALRFQPDPVDGFAGGSHVTSVSGDTRAVKATGVQFRNMASFGAWYWGGVFDFASITDGPQLVADGGGIARDSTSMIDTSTHGFVVESKFAVGRHARFGSLMFGAELAPGARIAGYSTATVPTGEAMQAWFVLDAQVRGDVWLSPNFTLGATAGVDLLDTHDVSFAITLGAHLVPYDHLN